MLFRSTSREILERLAGLDQRIGALESTIGKLLSDASQRETALREQLDVKRQELEALGVQALHVVEQLDGARRRIRELEGKA